MLRLLWAVCPAAAGSGTPAGPERARGPGQAAWMDKRGLRPPASSGSPRPRLVAPGASLLPGPACHDAPPVLSEPTFPWTRSSLLAVPGQGRGLWNLVWREGQ